MGCGGWRCGGGAVRGGGLGGEEEGAGVEWMASQYKSIHIK